MDYLSKIEMSGSGFEMGQDMPSTEEQLSTLPEYFVYLSLLLKLIMAVMIWLIAGWVLFTIKTTRRLYKPHNIFVANLMTSDMIFALLETIANIDFALGLGLINCNVRKFLLFPITVNHFTYLMISVDKVIAIKFPFKHKKMMTPFVVFGMITSSWLLAVLLAIIREIVNDKGDQLNGPCISLVITKGPVVFLSRMLPFMLTSSLMVSLNIYLTIKAYLVNKDIQKETRLSGVSHEVEILRQKRNSIKKNLKPVITLLVVIFGSSSIAVLFILVVNVSQLLWDHQTIMKVEQVLGPNILYIVMLLHPIVYGLYFKQVRESMMKTLKRLFCWNKFNTAVITPMPQKTAWM